MRISLATALLVGLTFSATGQPPAVPPKAPPKATAKTPTKAAPTPEPKADAKAPTGQEYPNQVSGKTLDQWIKELDSSDPSQRVMAINTVGLFGPSAKKAIPALSRQVRNVNNDYAVRANAILVLRHLVPLDLQNYAKEAVDALSMALDSTQGILKFQAAHALAAIGPAARVTVPKLVKLVEDRGSAEIRQAAAMALGRVAFDENNYPDLRALNALAYGIDDASREVRLDCLQAIINLGPPTAGASLQFKELLTRRLPKEKDNSAKIWVRVALMRMDEKQINDTNLTAIAKLMTEKDDVDIRIQAARAIGFIGPSAKAKIPELIEALQDPEPLMVWQAIWSLSRMEKDAEKALSAIQRIADDDKANADVRKAAQQAVESIKKK